MEGLDFPALPGAAQLREELVETLGPLEPKAESQTAGEDFESFYLCFSLSFFFVSLFFAFFALCVEIRRVRLDRLFSLHQGVCYVDHLFPLSQGCGEERRGMKRWYEVTNSIPS